MKCVGYRRCLSTELQPTLLVNEVCGLPPVLIYRTLTRSRPSHVAILTDYCIDGVCLLPPGAQPGHVCQPKPELPPPSEAAAFKALRAMMRDRVMDDHSNHQ